MLDLHGNIIKVGDFVKNRGGLIGKVIIRDGYESVKYQDAERVLQKTVKTS